MAIFIKVQHFAYVKKLVVEKYVKNAKFQTFDIKTCQLATLI